MLHRTEARRLLLAAATFHHHLSDQTAADKLKIGLDEAFADFAADRTESAAHTIVTALGEVTARADHQLVVDLLDITDEIVNPDKASSSLDALRGRNRLAFIAAFAEGEYPKAVEYALDVFTGMIEA